MTKEQARFFNSLNQGVLSPLFKTIDNSFDKLRKNDPLFGCQLFKDKGCSHVDGMLCDFPKCSMNIDYVEQLKT